MDDFNRNAKSQIVVVYRLQYLYYINFFYRVEFPELMLITYYLT